MSEFRKVDWCHQTNIYEVNLRQYTQEGTFNAFARELPRLRDMGVETLWFMPITPISELNRKGTLGSYYACSDYCSINPEFGTLDDFKNLVMQSHDLGFKVIIDWVANHTGWDHVWTKSNPDFYHRNEHGSFFDKHGWEDVIDLNYYNGEMRHQMKEAMKYWVTECDIDGFRCDMAMLVGVDFWKEARRELDQVKHLFWLAELDQWDNPDYLEVFDACYTWKWMHKAREFYQLRNLDINGLYAVLVHYDSLWPKSAIRTWFTSNHDENTWNGSEYEKYGDMAKALAVFSCTWSGVPMIYSGQELPNHKRLKFFEKDSIEWKTPVALHDFYKKLLHLHSTHPALRTADEAVQTHHLHTNADQEIFSFLRKNGEHEVLVILNFSSRYKSSLEILDDKINGEFTELFSGKKYDFKGQPLPELLAWQYLVFVK
jgi:alpha-amylase